MIKKLKPEVKKAIDEIHDLNHVETLKAELNRARSINVGNAFGGVTEIGLRSAGGTYLWCLLQPTEVTELIHQLSANIGCHIHLQPRKDFASWRIWRDDKHEQPMLSFPPWPNHPPQNLEGPPPAKLSFAEQRQVTNELNLSEKIEHDDSNEIILKNKKDSKKKKRIKDD